MANSVIGALRVMLGMDTAEFEAGSSRAQREARRLERRFQRVGRNLQRIGVGMTAGLTAPLAAFGVSSFKAASDAAELQSAFDQTFGELSGTMNQWAEETGNAMGRSTQSMQQLANTFGIFFNQAAETREEAARMSQTFAVLAQDLASFYNVSESDALQKLRSGLSGEAEPLRDFGVFLSAAAVEAKALELGLADASGEISEQAKILARYQLILESTTNAQGDVMRTSDGTANQMRRAAAAFEELQVKIGNVLLPVITPLIEKFGALMDRIGALPEGTQTAIVVIGGLAAAAGPLLIVLGSLVTLAPAIAAGFAAISAAAAPIAAVVAAVAAGGYLIYQNWDKIGPLLGRLAEQFQSTIGEPLREMVATISEKLTELWNGPLGDGLRFVGEKLLEFQLAYSEVMGSALLRVIDAAITQLSGFVNFILDGLTVVSRLLEGDFSGAWRASKDMIANFAQSMLDTFDALLPGVIGSVQGIYEGAREWLQNKLGAVFDWVNTKIEQVTGSFHDMYVAVVGNSYVPDMVDEIGQEFDRLDALMVEPAKKATRDVTAATREMARDVRDLLDQLFPEIARERQKIADLRLLDGAGLSPGALRRARLALIAAGMPKTHEVTLDQGPLREADQVENAAERMADAMAKSARKTQEQAVRIVRSFREMAQSSIAALNQLASAIKGGGFLDIVTGLLGFGLELGGMGLFGKKIQTRINSSDIPRFAKGGSMMLGGFGGVDKNLLSLNGTPLARVSRGETMSISPANDRGALNVVVTMDESTGALGAFVRNESGKVVAQAAPGIAQLGSSQALGEIRRANERRLA